MDRKILFLLAITIPLLTMGAGCAKQIVDAQNNSPTNTVKAADEVTNESAKYRTYSQDQSIGLSFQYPADWNVKEKNEIETNSIDVRVSSPEWNSPHQGAEFLVWLNVPGVGYEYLNKNLGNSKTSIDGIPATKDILSDETGKINAVIFKLQSGDLSYFIKYEFVVNKDSDKDFYLTILDNIMKTFKFNKYVHAVAETATTPWATKACNTIDSMPYSNKKIISPILDTKFKGVVISDIAKNYLALSGSKAAAVTAVVSPNGSQLVVDYVSCDGKIGQDANNFGMDGTVSHLVVFTSSDAKSGKNLAHLPTFSGSNFYAIYLPVGFIGETSNVLVNGKIIDMGAGGSCAAIYWLTINTDTSAMTNFTTVPEYTIYGKNSHIVYVTPNSCTAPPQNIYVKNILTGAEQLMKKVSGDEFISFQGVEEKNSTYILNYTVLNSLNQNSASATVVLP